MKDDKTFLSILIGDSVSMARWAEGIEIENTYSYLMEMYWRERYDNAYHLSVTMPGKTIRILNGTFSRLLGHIGSRDLGAAIIHLGVVDCAPRVLPATIHEIPNHLPGFLRERIFSFLHNNRPRLQKMGWSFRFTDPAAFKSSYRELTKNLTSKTERLYVINISPGTDQIYNQSPGLKESIILYNNIIRETIAEYPAIRLVDVYSEFGKDPGRYLTGDLHITADGHTYIYEQIVEQEKKRTQL